MSDDINKKIKQITDILGQENIPDNIRGLLSMLTNDNKGDTPRPTPPIEVRDEIKDDVNKKNDMEDNINTLYRVKKIVDKLNTTNDPRINLINAIRPFLNSSRQKKINGCIKVLQMSNLSKVMDD